MPQLGPPVPLWSLCILLVVMALKHYVADFLLQTNWMAHGKERREGWQAPLAVHVLCHGVITLVIMWVVAPRLWWLALVDIAVHATIDRCKTLIGLRGGWDAQRAEFWWLIGFDQMLHQITNIALVAALYVL
ncbi:MAG: DUF3307 domain-containing protein [Roseiarcus sp.]